MASISFDENIKESDVNKIVEINNYDILVDEEIDQYLLEKERI